MICRLVASSWSNGRSLSTFRTPSTCSPSTIGTASSARTSTARRRLHVARVGGDVVHQLDPALAHGGAHDAGGDGQAVLVLDGAPVLAAARAHHQRVRVARVDERDVHVLVAEQLVDGLGRALQQVVERQVGRDDVADARDQRQPLGAALLPLVAPRVLDRDGGVAGEQRQRLDRLLVEAPRCGSAQAEEAEEALLPQDRHRHHRHLAELGPDRIRHARVGVEDDRLPLRDHEPGEPLARALAPPPLARGQAVLGHDLHRLRLFVVEADRAVLPPRAARRPGAR